MKQKSDPGTNPGATNLNHHHTNNHHEVGRRTFDFTARKAVIAAGAWRYKDAAKTQARQGIISWPQFREFCAEVDRITRARLTKAQTAADLHTATEPADTWAGTPALMRAPQRKPRKGRGSRPDSDVKDCPLDHEYRKRRDAAIRGVLISALSDSDEQVAARLGITPVFVASIRENTESAENPKKVRRQRVAESLRAAPELSNREHARRCGVDDKTVASHRKRLEESAQIPHFLHRIDPRTGRHSQPARKRNTRPPDDRPMVDAILCWFTRQAVAL